MDSIDFETIADFNFKMVQQIRYLQNEEGPEYNTPYQYAFCNENLYKITTVAKASNPFFQIWYIMKKICHGTMLTAIHNILKAAGIFMDHITLGQYITRCKALTVLAKQYQSKFSIYWRYLVDWSMLGAYQIVKSSPDVNDLNVWLLQQRLNDAANIPFFYDYLKDGVKSFFSKVAAIPDYSKQLDVDSFLQSPWLWATSGSSTYLRHNVLVQGIKARSNKWLLAYTTSLIDKKRLFFSNAHAILRPFVKPDEPIKSRYIVTSDDSLYLKMAYISHILNPLLHNHPNTLIYSDNDDYYHKFSTLRHDKMNGLCNLDIDQSAFDHHVSKEFVLYIVSYICSFVRSHLAESLLFEYDTIVVALMTQFANQRIILDNVDMGQWQNGVASGWAWTSLIDTIANYAQNYAIFATLNYPMPNNILCFGDDMTVLLPHTYNLNRIVAAWGLFNYEVALNKTLMNTENGEFLRYTYGAEGIFGYPVRTARSIVINNTTMDDIETLKIIILFLVRMLAVSSTSMLFKQPYDDLVHISTIYGGYALPPIIRPTFKYEPSVHIVPRIKNVDWLPYQIERIGLKGAFQICVRKSSFKHIFSQLIETERVISYAYFITHDHFWQHAYYVNDEQFNQQLYKNGLIESELIPLLDIKSKDFYLSVLLHHATRNVRLKWLANRLPEPTIYTIHPRVAAMLCGNAFSHILRDLHYSKISIGVIRKINEVVERSFYKSINAIIPYVWQP